MSTTNRRVASVRNLCMLSSLTALLALGLTIPASADKTASAERASSETVSTRWHTPQVEPAMQVASAGTLQAALATNAVAVPAAARGGGQVSDLLPGTPVWLRLGLSVSPRTKFVGGADITLPQLSLGPGFVSRIDAEAVVSANFGGASTLVPVTFDQVYSKGLVSGTRTYVGAGIGPYIGEVTRFGGKIFVGATQGRIGGELGVHFTGFGDPLLTLQARFRL